jgi:hypothetical protein
MAVNRQNTKAFEAELKRCIQDGVHGKICLYYRNQEYKPPKMKIRVPDFTIEQQNDLDPEKINNTWKNTVYLFFTSKIPDCCRTSEEVKKEFEKLNKRHGKNCMPQVNTGHFEKPICTVLPEHCLYVGSCKEKTQNRVKHHLGELSGMYGLHLGEWWGKTPIQIFFLVFPDNISGEYLNLIEDVLWEAYRPLFGKKGPR